MKRVLMIAYQFPPVGGSGVQRTLKFTKFLSGYGWLPEVVTRDDGRMAQRDETLLPEVPREVRVIRTPAHDLTSWPGKLALVGKFIAWKLLVPDGEIPWMRGAVQAARKRMVAGGIDVVYTTSYPYTDHLIGLALKKNFPGVPWVADFRDEWTNNPYLLDHPHPAWRMKRERQMERRVLEQADVLITNSPGMKDNFVRSYPQLHLQERMHVIPNGFDPDDFTLIQKTKPANQRFTITYTGALYGRRKPDLFIKAVGRLVTGKRIPEEQMLLRFIGSYKPEALQTLARENGMASCLHLVGYLPHGECLQAMAASDALLLLEGGGPGSEAFFTGKVFEYIHTGKPILAVVPSQGAAAGVVRDTCTGLVCDTDDIEGIMEGIVAFHAAWAEGRVPCEPRHDQIAVYDRRVLTKRLAELFDKAMAGKANVKNEGVAYEDMG